MSDGVRLMFWCLLSAALGASIGALIISWVVWSLS